MSKVSATPEQLRSAGGKMQALHDRVNGIFNKLEGALAGRGEPWGNDSYGSGFADGEQGYLTARENLKDGFGKLATTFKSYADGQKDAATLLAGMDKRNGQGFGRN
ncbi:WXG100 family type VII secretion target [Nocardia crassostreae]|uniref:WXG100 family type VII secretion target n=1 Tax=Nocardia crassostreae TaxID=53428 RepID=UPI0012FBBE79|nr:hypothetical protein [Nocardia crassostreae]